MTTGSLAKIFTGRRNQKIPTPKVKSGGKINVRRVALIPNPSQREKTKKSKVKKVRPLIARKRDESLIKLIPIKPSERRMEVTTNFFLLDKISIGKNFLNIVVIIKIL